MKLSDIQAMDYNGIMSLTTDELHKIVNTTRSVARKRLERIKNSDYEKTLATHNYEEEGGAKTTRGMNINQLRHELRRDLDFLDDRTSTIKGTDEVRQEFEARVSKLMGIPDTEPGWKISRRNYNRFWDLFEKLKEHPKTAIYARLAKYEKVQQDLAEIMTDQLLKEEVLGEDDDAIIDAVVALYDHTYEEGQVERNALRAKMEQGGGADVTGDPTDHRGNGNR